MRHEIVENVTRARKLNRVAFSLQFWFPGNTAAASDVRGYPERALMPGIRSNEMYCKENNQSIDRSIDRPAMYNLTAGFKQDYCSIEAVCITQMLQQGPNRTGVTQQLFQR